MLVASIVSSAPKWRTYRKAPPGPSSAATNARVEGKPAFLSGPKTRSAVVPLPSRERTVANDGSSTAWSVCRWVRRIVSRAER